MSGDMGGYTPSSPEMGDGGAKTKSNLMLLGIAGAFLVTTVALVLLQPGLDKAPTTQATAAQQSIPDLSVPQQSASLGALTQSQAAPVVAQQEDVVARAQLPLLHIIPTGPGNEIITSVAIAERLRQPIRLLQTDVPKRTLSMLADDTLMVMSPDKTKADPVLRDMIVTAVQNKHSDVYIKALVNSAAGRGEFEIPVVMRTNQGEFDTAPLLRAMAQLAGSPLPELPAVIETNGTQKITPGDSLGRLALRYYGQPLQYDIILAANPQIDPRNPVLVPGDVIQMPKP